MNYSDGTVLKYITSKFMKNGTLTKEFSTNCLGHLLYILFNTLTIEGIGLFLYLSVLALIGWILL